MARRPDDAVVVETPSGAFDRFQSLELTTDLLDAAVLSFEVGDDDSAELLERMLAPGREVRVYVNGLLQFTGRAEVNEAPTTADGGATVQVVCRTKMADARYASADPRLSLSGVSIRDFILRLYEPLGYGPGDFVFAPAADRDLVTGKRGGAEDPVDLEPLKAEQAKVNPPETIFAAAERHLKRHHLMHWDAADGRILVGRPDDGQQPTYRFLCRRGAGSAGNNVLGARRVVDWSEVPSEVWVFGGTGGKDVTRASLRGVSADLDLLAAAASTGHFARPVLIPAEGAKTQAQVDAQAIRERAARSRRKDAWETDHDAWTWWPGSGATVPLAINTTADVDVDTATGSARGRYLLARVSRALSAEGAAAARVSLLAPGVLQL